MATLKNFGLAGVNSDVQFGKGGPRVINTSGVLAVKNAAASALARLQAATPTEADDVTTKSFVETLVTEINSNAATDRSDIAALQNSVTTIDGRVDVLEANASTQQAAITGLENSVSALQSNTASLDGRIDATESAITSLEGSVSTLQSNAATQDGRLDTIEADIADHDTRLATAEDDITDHDTRLGLAETTIAGLVSNAATQDDRLDSAETSITDLQTNVELIEEAVGLNGDGSLPAWSTPNYIGSATSFREAVETLDDQIKANADAISAIGSAFNYVGTVAGGADTESAYDLSGLPSEQKNPGDYFKVSTTGYFKVGSGGTPFLANQNDGLVWNTTSGVDVIDNTNSTVSGTGGRITVTGSADTGFVVDIASNYSGQNTIATVGTITTGTWNGSTIQSGYGGTGFASYAAGDLLTGTSGGSLAKLAKGGALDYLRVNTSGTGLEYATLDANAVAFSHGGFSATDAAGALVELADDIAAIQDDLQNLSQDQIQGDTGNTKVVAAAAGVELFDGGAKFATLVGTTANATLRAEGVASDIDIVLDPKGTGVIDASAAKITNVANAVADTDALNLGFADARFLARKVANVSENNSVNAIGAVDGLVVRIMVIVVVAFGGNFTVGTSDDNDLLVALTDFDPTNVAIYEVTNVAEVSGTVNAYVSGSGSGSARVIIEYLPN